MLSSCAFLWLRISFQNSLEEKIGKRAICVILVLFNRWIASFLSQYSLLMAVAVITFITSYRLRWWSCWLQSLHIDANLDDLDDVHIYVNFDIDGEESIIAVVAVVALVIIKAVVVMY